MATSLTAEIRQMCTPMSIQSLPSTGDFQDHVSFGLVAAQADPRHPHQRLLHPCLWS